MIDFKIGDLVETRNKHDAAITTIVTKIVNRNLVVSEPVLNETSDSWTLTNLYSSNPSWPSSIVTLEFTKGSQTRYFSSQVANPLTPDQLNAMLHDSYAELLDATS